MSHFAKIGENNIVLEVLYVETSVTSTAGGIEDESIGITHLRTHHHHDNWKRVRLHKYDTAGWIAEKLFKNEKA